MTVSTEGAVFYKLVEGDDHTPTTIQVEDSFPSYPQATLAKFAPNNGQLAVIADPTGLHIVDSQTGRELRLILRSTPISAITFSPRDTYFVTCEKYVQGEKNLIVWNLQSGNELVAFEWKKGSKDGAKSIKFSDDEHFFARISSRTQIDIYETSNSSTPKTIINANDETLGKKKSKAEEAKGIKGKFWFDGFEFIPSHTSV